MPTRLQWKLFHYLNREGKITKDWDSFSTMSNDNARAYLDKKLGKGEPSRISKILERNRRRV